MFYNIYNLLVQ